MINNHTVRLLQDTNPVIKKHFDNYVPETNQWEEGNYKRREEVYEHIIVELVEENTRLQKEKIEALATNTNITITKVN